MAVSVRQSATSRWPASRICALPIGSARDLDDRTLVVFEVEPRPQENGYRFYVCDAPTAIHWSAVEASLLAIRAYEGRIPKSRLRDTFIGVTPNVVVAFNHSYERDTDGAITDLNPNALHLALRRVPSTSAAST